MTYKHLNKYLLEASDPPDPKAVADLIVKTLEKQGWKNEGGQSKPTSGFIMSKKDDQYTFKVACADDGTSDSQLSGKVLNKLVDTLYREVRAKGGIFTQPTGVSGSGWTHGNGNNKTHGQIIEFTVG